jgi:hypothetical protein
MNPESHGQLATCLTGSLGPDVQIKAILTIGGLIAIALFGSVEARIVNGLIAGMSEPITLAHAFPFHYGLWLTPTQIANRCRCIGYALVSKNDLLRRVFYINTDTLNLSALDRQYRAFVFFLTVTTAKKSQ